MDLPEVTDDPYLLSQIVAEIPGTIVVTDRAMKLEEIDGMGQMNRYEEPISLSQPLADGRHDLRFQRMMSDGRVSEATHYSLMVDSYAPEITLGDFERETNLPRVLLKLNLSDDVRDLYPESLITHTQINRGVKPLIYRGTFDPAS